MHIRYNKYKLDKQIHIRLQQYTQDKYGLKNARNENKESTIYSLYIVSDIFSHRIAHTFLPQYFDFHHFTTYIYPSHYTPLSPLPYTAL